jgi:hypothetical protein
VVSEEEADEDDEGPVDLTGAYKGLEIDIKRLKERLRYFSKKWEIRNIAICEEDRIATELRKAGSSVIEKQKQTVTLNCCKKNSQKEEPGSNGSESEIVEREASQYALKRHETSASSVTVVSAISASLLQEAEVKIKLLNCDYDRAEQEQRAGQYLNRVTMQARGRKFTTIEQLVEVTVASLMHGKLARATNKVFTRWVIDLGGTQPGRH